MAFGRSDIADRVGRSEARVLLLTGDSGIGKTTVLQLSTAERPGWLYADPLTLAASGGSLYQAFLESLGAILASLVEGGLGVPSVGERLAATGTRLVNEKLSILGRVAVAEVIAVIRGKVGDEVGKAIAVYAKSIWPDSAETLAAKAAQARDPLAVDVLSAFAEAASQLAGELHLAVSLDQGQRLSEDDRRLLRDLSERLPRFVHLRVAFATDNPERSRSVAELLADVTSIAEVEVPPLDEGDVAEWLLAEGLPSTEAPRIRQATGGYPLLVEVVIPHLKDGGALEDIPRHRQLAARTRASWNMLSSEAAAVARKLAVLHDPLPEAELRQLAEVHDLGTWATVVSELRQARIFSVEVNGQAWFHGERRAFVLHECLTASQRTEAAADAAELIWARLSTADDVGLSRQFAELVAQAPRLQDAEPYLRAALALDGPVLAAAAALLELATGDRLAAVAESVFSHALRFLDRIEDPTAVLSELEASGLVQTASNEHATAVAAAWGPMTQAVVQGRTSLILGKTAVPWLVEATFAVALREPLGEFESVRIGIGTPSIGGLSRMSVNLEPEPRLGRPGYVDRRRLGHSLLVRAMVGELPLYCAAAYADDSVRDAAQEATEQLDVITSIGRVQVTSAVLHPSGPVTVQRFAFAAARATGQSRPNPHDSGDIRVDAPPGLPDVERVRRRVETAWLLRSLSAEIDEMAYELDRGFLLIWDGGDDYWNECIVQGAGDGQRREPALARSSGFGHYEGFRLRQALGLGPGQAIARRTTRAGVSVRRDDPLFAEVAYRRGRARVFNSAQPRLRVAVDAEELSTRIKEGFLAELADARAFRGQLSFLADSPRIGPTALWLLIVLDEPDPSFVAGARGMAWYAEGNSPSDEDVVRVELVKGHPRDDGWLYAVEPQTFRRVFPEAPSAGNASLDFAICRYLRHHPDDVEFVWPDEK
jgi:hypothetical protein